MNFAITMGWSIDEKVRKELDLPFEDWVLDDVQVDFEERTFMVRYVTPHEHIPIDAIQYEYTGVTHAFYERSVSSDDVEALENVMKNLEFWRLFDMDIDEIESEVKSPEEWPTLELHIMEPYLGYQPHINEVIGVFKMILQKAKALQEQE
jgi:hypothetical protein